MKKLVLALLTLGLVLSTAACSSKPADNGGTSSNETYTIRVLNYESKTATVLMEYVVQQWEELFGDYPVEFVIDTLPFAEKLQKCTEGDFEISFSGWSPDYAWPTTFLDMWKIGSEYNEIGYASEEYTNLVNGADKDPATAFADLQAAEKVLLEDGVLIPVYQRGGTMVQNPDVKGIIKHSIGFDYSYKWATKADGTTINLLEIEKLPSLDAMLATDAVSFLNLGNLAEGLLIPGEAEGSAIEGVANEWNFDEATMTWTFNLRDDANWIDSKGQVVRPVTANDFVYAWDRVFAEDSVAQYKFMKDIAKITEYKAVDDKTLTVTVSENVPYFESLMTFGTFLPVPAEFAEEKGATYGTTLDTFLSNGPFYLSKWDHSSEVIWTKNDNYWDADVVKIPGVTYRVIEQYDPATGVALFNDGAIDRVGLSGEFVEQFKDDPRTFSFTEASTFYFMINVGNANGVVEEYDQENGGNPLLDNLNVRKALALAFDKAFIAYELDKNGSIPSDYFVPANFSTYEGEPYEAARGEGYMHYNTEEALKYWEAGMEELGISKK